MAAHLQSRIPHARVHVKRAPGGGTVVLLDDAHAVDPGGPPPDAAWLRGSVEALETAARITGLFGAPLTGTDALLQEFSAHDAERHQALTSIVQAEGFPFREEARMRGARRVS